MRHTCLGTLAVLLGWVAWAGAQEHCPTWSPGDPTNLKSAYRTLIEACGCAAPKLHQPKEGPVDVGPVPVQCGPFSAWCGEPADFWFAADVGAYRMKQGSVATLAGPIPAVTGNRDVDHETFVGGRFTLGAWISYAQWFGVEGTYFFVGEKTDERSEVTAGAGFTTAVSSAFQQGSGSGVFNYQCGPGQRIDVLVGFTYLELAEEARLRQLAGGAQVATDGFDTHSRFYGGHVGLRGEWLREAWVFRATGKLALGVNHHALRGSSGGLFPATSTLTQRDEDKWGIVPELDLSVGYRVCERATLFAGYNFLYWNSVVRVGEQIAVAVDPRQELRDDTFWLQGLRIGFEVRY